MVNYVNSHAITPTFFVVIILILIVYFSLGKNGEEGGSTAASILVIILLVIAIIIAALKYFFNINITTYMYGFFDPSQLEKEIDINIDSQTDEPPPVPESFIKQVFNIPGNTYTYNDAAALCKAYGGDLATYKQVEEAYQKGGEWCNYGWSKDQLALFPTQQKTYDTLQAVEGHENDCGRPGVNGGFIANPMVKFGANCYGHKPDITPEESDLMDNASPLPTSKEDMMFQQRVDYWRNNIQQVLVSPFNHSSWNESLL